MEVCIGTKWLSFGAGISNLITYSCGSNRHYEITEKGVFLKVLMELEDDPGLSLQGRSLLYANPCNEISCITSESFILSRNLSHE